MMILSIYRAEKYSDSTFPIGVKKMNVERQSLVVPSNWTAQGVLWIIRREAGVPSKL